MDNSQNFDGFDGMPVDLWTSQLQQHQELSSVCSNFPNSAYQAHNVPAVRDFVSPHSLAGSFSTEVPATVIGQPQQVLSSSSSSSSSPSVLQPRSLLSVPKPQAKPRQAPSQHSGVDRSAWSHLISLDPSMAAVGSYDHSEALPQAPRDISLGTQHLAHVQESISGMMRDSNKRVPTIAPNISLPAFHLATSSNNPIPVSFGNFSEYSYPSPQQDRSQQLNQLMNLSKKALESNMPEPLRTLTINTDVPSLQSSSYSPVSPPGGDVNEADFNSSHNSGKVAELLCAEGQEVPQPTTTTFASPLHRDMFQILSAKSNVVDVPKNVNVTHTNLIPNMSDFQSASLSVETDMPLDMTNRRPSRSEEEQPEVSAAEDNLNNVDLAVSFPSGSKSSSDRVPLLQSLLTRPQANFETSYKGPPVSSISNSAVESNTQSQLLDSTLGKISKPMKSTPKKSNFYGRDVSLFSMSLLSSEDKSMELIEPSEKKPASQEISAVSTYNHISVNRSEPLDLVCEDLKQDCSQTSQNANKDDFSEISVNTDVSTSVCDSISGGDHFYDGEKAPFNFSMAESADYFIDACTEKKDDVSDLERQSLLIDSPEKEVNDTNVKCSELSTDVDIDFQNVTEPKTENATNLETLGHDGEQDLKNDLTTKEECNSLESNESKSRPVVTPIIIKVKAPRGRKKKNVSFNTRIRKKNTKKAAMIGSETLDASNDFDGSRETKLESGISQSEQNAEDLSGQVFEAGAPKRRKLSVKGKAPNVDPLPRRSSSRRSKANAMRLIELQADSNYTGFSQSEDTEKEKRPARRRKLQAKLENADNELSSLSDTEVSSEPADSDGGGDVDYIVDEDEAETANKEEQMEVQKNESHLKERRSGSLKISIKLGSNSKPQIVSRILDSPIKKKKALKRKHPKQKKAKKGALKHPQECEDDVLSHPEQETKQDEDSAGLGDKHLMLMEKYFSSANTASAAKNTNKSELVSKRGKVKRRTEKKVGSQSKQEKLKLEARKLGEVKVNLKRIVGLDDSVNKSLKSEQDIAKSELDSDIPKFVCGYCPQKYHSKKELLSHVEDHMNDMEGKDGNGEKQGVATTKIKNPVSFDVTAVKNSRHLVSIKSKAVEKSDSKSSVVQPKESISKDAGQALTHTLKCGECEQIFGSKHDLLEHVRIHTVEKPFECDMCHKCFQDRISLSSHRKTHTQDRLLRCEVCSKPFVHKTDLASHMQTHPKRFVNSGSVKKVIPPAKSKKLGENSRKQAQVTSSLPPPKPKSFASALGGDEEVEKSSTLNTLLLKRGDTMPSVKPSSTHVKGLVNESVVSAGSKSNVKPYSITNVSESTNKDSGNVEKWSVQSHIKSTITEASVTNSTAVDSSGNCTCKECPECVTRFLQSFE